MRASQLNSEIVRAVLTNPQMQAYVHRETFQLVHRNNQDHITVTPEI